MNGADVTAVNFGYLVAATTPLVLLQLSYTWEFSLQKGTKGTVRVEVRKLS